MPNVTTGRLAVMALAVATALLGVSVLSEQSHARGTQAPCYVVMPYPGRLGVACSARALDGRRRTRRRPSRGASRDGCARRFGTAEPRAGVGGGLGRVLPDAPVGIWNRGEYAGYPSRPQLQLKWFLDSAISMRLTRYSARGVDVTKDPSSFGEWIADVERPAEQLRGRYQLRLADARRLLGAATP